jgi:hypothetical protein
MAKTINKPESVKKGFVDNKILYKAKAHSDGHRWVYGKYYPLQIEGSYGECIKTKDNVYDIDPDTLCRGLKISMLIDYGRHFLPTEDYYVGDVIVIKQRFLEKPDYYIMSYDEYLNEFMFCKHDSGSLFNEVEALPLDDFMERCRQAVEVEILGNVFDNDIEKLKQEDKKKRLTFGKYKGWKVDWVIIEDASYLWWAHNNVSYFTLNPEQLAEVKDRVKSRKKHDGETRIIPVFGCEDERDELWDEDDDDDMNWHRDYDGTF